MMLSDDYSPSPAASANLEARFDCGRALWGLLGSLFIAGICIWAGEHYALIGGLIGIVGVGFSLRGLLDDRVRLRIDSEGVHLPLKHTSLTWREIDHASWRVVTRGASQQSFVILALTNGRSLQINISALNVSLAVVCAIIEEGIR